LIARNDGRTRAKTLLDQLKYYVEQNKQSFADLEQSPEFEAIKTNKYEEAKLRVLTSLVLGAIIKEEGITVEEEELQNHIEDFITRMGLPPEKAARNDAVHRQALEELLTGKVMQLLMHHTKVEHIPAPAAVES